MPPEEAAAHRRAGEAGQEAQGRQRGPEAAGEQAEEGGRRAEEDHDRPRQGRLPDRRFARFFARRRAAAATAAAKEPVKNHGKKKLWTKFC